VAGGAAASGSWRRHRVESTAADNAGHLARHAHVWLKSLAGRHHHHHPAAIIIFVRGTLKVATTRGAAAEHLAAVTSFLLLTVDIAPATGSFASWRQAAWPSPDIADMAKDERWLARISAARQCVMLLVARREQM